MAILWMRYADGWKHAKLWHTKKLKMQPAKWISGDEWETMYADERDR